MCMRCNRIFTISYSFFFSFLCHCILSFLCFFVHSSSHRSLSSSNVYCISFCFFFSFSLRFTHTPASDPPIHSRANRKAQKLPRWRSFPLGMETRTEWGEGAAGWEAEGPIPTGIEVLHAFDATQQTEANGRMRFKVFFFLFVPFVVRLFAGLFSYCIRTNTHTLRYIIIFALWLCAHFHDSFIL